MTAKWLSIRNLVLQMWSGTRFKYCRCTQVDKRACDRLLFLCVLITIYDCNMWSTTVSIS